MRRTAWTVLAAVAWSVVAAAPASAHSVAGAAPSNYRTRLLHVTGRVAGVEVRVVESGSRFEVVNHSAREVLVLGYQGEPYLRIGRDGVFENQRSPATYLNVSRTGVRTVPGTADPKAAPEWERVADGPSARWHDHRIHWMGTSNPPAVRRAPGSTHVIIPRWTIPMRIGTRRLEASGDLAWVPPPSPAPWLVLALALFGAVAALVTRPWWARGLAAALAALVVVDVIHAVGIALAGPGSIVVKILTATIGSMYALIAWASGVVGVVMLAKRRVDGLFAAGLSAAFIAIYGGLVDVSVLTRSQVPFAWAPPLARAMVAVSLGAGLGLLAAAVLGVRRYAERGDASAELGAERSPL